MAILNLTALDQTPLQRDPFEFFVAKDGLRAEALDALNQDYPEMQLPANYSPNELSYGPAFKALLDEIDSPEFEAAISRKFNIDLSGTQKSITVRKYSEPSDGNIHTDHWSKVITVLMYFNPEWNQEGGKLRLLRSLHDIEDYAAEVEPVGGTLLAFKRSKNSFHGYKQFKGERRMLQVNWVRASIVAWYAQQISRMGTHMAKGILRQLQG